MFRYTPILLIVSAFLICTKFASASHVDVMLPENAILTGTIIFEKTKYHSYPEKYPDVKIPIKIQLNNYQFNKWIDAKAGLYDSRGNYVRYDYEWKLKLEFFPNGNLNRGNMSSQYVMYSLSGAIERLEGKKKDQDKAWWNVFIDFSNPDYDTNIAYHNKQENIQKKKEENKIIKLENKVKELESQTLKAQNLSLKTDKKISSKDYSFKRKMCDSAQDSENTKASFMQSISQNELTRFLESGQDCSIF